MTADSEPEAADPVEAIKRYCRGLKNALQAVDQMNPAARIITDRMRETIQTFNVDLDQLRYFTRGPAE